MQLRCQRRLGWRGFRAQVPPGDRARVASKTLDRRRDGCLIALIRRQARVDCGQLPYSPYFQQVSGPQQQPTPTWVGGPMLSTKLASIATSCDEGRQAARTPAIYLTLG